MELRYIMGQSWERISVEMHYDSIGKNVFKIHGQALMLLKVTLNYTFLRTESSGVCRGIAGRWHNACGSRPHKTFPFGRDVYRTEYPGEPVAYQTRNRQPEDSSCKRLKKGAAGYTAALYASLIDVIRLFAHHQLIFLFCSFNWFQTDVRYFITSEFRNHVYIEIKWIVFR